MNGPASRR